MKNNLKYIYENSTILIVDDSAEYLNILSDILKPYRTKVALNGKTALKIAFSESQPSIILLDIMMPEVDGFEVLRILKDNPKTSYIPVIFITALNDIKDIIKGLEMGAVDYITKPFNSDEVICRVNTHLYYITYCKKIENINFSLEEEVKNRTAELLYAKEKAEESCRLKSHFLSLISHELRTPMVGVLGYSEILKDELINHPAFSYVENLVDSSKRLFETLNSILALSKLEHNKQSLEITEFDIIERIKSLLKVHEINAAEKGLELSFKTDFENEITQLDKTKFDVIFNNILNNAIKYTLEGKIEIEVSEKYENAIKYFIITVLDSGIGIPEESHKIIFEEFRQVDEGAGRKFEGVGLGLSLVKKYVTSLKGKVELKSEVGKGSKFIISLPCYLSFNDFAIQKLEKQKNKKIKLLVVNCSDNSFNKDIFDDFCECKIVSSLDEIIVTTNCGIYECILVDLNLLDHDSIEKEVSYLRSIKKTNKIPIIAFADFEHEYEKLNLIKNGFTYVVSKSESNEKIKDIIYNSVCWRLT